ncbi:type II toxin-antitoxin system TacA family antitoxin [Methylococcus geothermalis]|uniref:DUF1778 domain-containing protein n=1 Tax=Methylococcus geothermalis TaxID=2681310 RepID=A0A858Q4H5_9GAMM|nr:DUF1778 domain-containing protein [Methylococcus geothermalis]QJD28750.1 DUF1778 domain-containing protein [Methylococcus geothermalis]
MAVKQLLQEAARACHKNVSEFLLDAGVTAAAQTLADRRQFVLDEAQWQAFQEALDRPVQSKPRLTRRAAKLKNKGLGQGLLKDALLRTAQAADIAGIRCLLVHAKDDAARQWYESWEFEPSPTDPYHLFLMLKDLKNLLS